MGKTRRRLSGLLLLACFLLVACGGPEAKKAKFLERGKEYYAKKDFVKAGLEFKNAIQIDPKFAEAYHQLGLSQLSRADIRGAYGSLSKATELDPKLLPAQFQLGKLLLIVGERERAMEKAELVLKSAPDDVDAQLLKGAVLAVGKETAKARAYLEGLEAKGIARPDLYLLLARVYTQEKDSRSAEAALLRGIKGNGKDIALRRALADLYAAGGRHDAAAEQVKEVIALQPDMYGNSITLAALYWNTKQEPKGREVLTGLLAAKPLDEDRRLDVARFYLSRGAVADAEKLLQEGIRGNAKTFRLRFALADVYKNTGRSDQAVAVLNECLALDKDRGNPDILTALNALAKVHLERREVDKAKGYADEVVKASPKNVDAHMVRGNLDLLKGDGAGAVAEFRTVVGERPQFVPGYLLLAEGHLLKKEMNLAQEALQNALKADPKSRDARRALGRFHAMQKEYPKAEENLRMILGGEPVGPGGAGRPGRCVPGREAAGEGGGGVRGDQAPGAEAAVRVREDGRFLPGAGEAGPGGVRIRGGDQGGPRKPAALHAPRKDPRRGEGVREGREGVRGGAGPAAGLLDRRERPGGPAERAPRDREGAGPGARAGPGRAEEPPRRPGRAGHPRMGLLQEGGQPAGARPAREGAGEAGGTPRGQLPPGDGDGEGGEEGAGQGVPSEIGRGEG